MNINNLKGQEFEEHSLNIIQRVFSDLKMGNLEENFKIQKLKGYYSQDRLKEIIFDLTIEFWPPGANKYSLLYIIECKNFSRRVPPNKLEDFYSKIRQVSGANMKGIFITNSPLQEGALNFANSKGIMVIQAAENEQGYNLVLYKSNRANENYKIPFIYETYDPILIDSGAELIEKQIDVKFKSVFAEILFKKNELYGLKKLSREYLSKVAIQELNKIEPKILSSGRVLNTTILKDYLNRFYGIQIEDNIINIEKLGALDFQKNIIYLNKSVVGTPRELFILCHEFGHYLFHYNLQLGQELYDLFEDFEENFKEQKNGFNNPRQWIEWQANYFAASIIFPKPLFDYWLNKYQRDLGLKEGIFYLDDQIDNVKKFIYLTNKMANVFKVTKTSIIYRMKELGYLIENSRTKSIGEILIDYKDDFFL
ncbi:ImmA/IrrE family metallo-endopeptidase [Aquirufa nivalisilvae]